MEIKGDIDKKMIIFTSPDISFGVGVDTQSTIPTLCNTVTRKLSVITYFESYYRLAIYLGEKQSHLLRFLSCCREYIDKIHIERVDYHYVFYTDEQTYFLIKLSQ